MIEIDSIFDLYLMSGALLGVIVFFMGLGLIYAKTVERRMAIGVLWLGVIVAIPFLNILLGGYIALAKISQFFKRTK